MTEHGGRAIDTIGAVSGRHLLDELVLVLVRAIHQVLIKQLIEA